MILTVLWEDSRSPRANKFGPDLLLRACVADDLGTSPNRLERYVVPQPRKGNGSVVKALRQDLERLVRSGPVFAVIDRDKVKQLVASGLDIPDCRAEICARFRAKAPGDYELVLLEDNMESLIAAACTAMGLEPPGKKPSPDERDRILARAAWATSPERRRVREVCPTFDRIVLRVAAALQGLREA